LKYEVRKIKGLLRSTLCQLCQAVAEKAKVVADSQQASVTRMDELKHNAEVAQSSMASHLQAQDDPCRITSETLTGLADSVKRFLQYML
jgi:hypothetical protein